MKKFLIPILALVFLISAFAKADDFIKLSNEQIEDLVNKCSEDSFHHKSFIVLLNDPALMLSVFNPEIAVQPSAVQVGAPREYVLRIKPSSQDKSFNEVQSNLISMLKFNRAYIQDVECNVVFQPDVN